jgi:hypothetical protein
MTTDANVPDGTATVPWWMRPALLIGRLRPALGASVDADANAFRSLPSAASTILLPALAVVLVVVPSIVHALAGTGPTAAEADWTRLWFVDVYTESFPFMAGALVLGIVSPALGAFLVLVFAVVDLGAAALQPHELVPLPLALVGRLVSYWLLWVLVVEGPLLGRAMAESTSGARLWRAAVGAAVIGGFVWLWTVMAAVLIRAPHILSHLFAPQPAAVYPLQTAGLQIAVVGAVAMALVVAARTADGLLGVEPPAPRGWQGRPAGVARHVAVAAGLTVGLWGVIGAPWHAVALFAALVLARPVASIVAPRIRAARAIPALPPAALAGALCVLGIAVAVLTVPPIDTYSNTWDRVVIGIVAIIVVLELAGAVARQPPADGAGSRVAAASTGALLWLAIAFVSPSLALADNCADPGDCFGQWPAAALAAGATGAFMAARRNPQRDEEALKRKKLDYIEKQMKKDPDNPYWQRQHQYWSGDTSAKSDDKPTSAASFPSSGAATKG